MHPYIGSSASPSREQSGNGLPAVGGADGFGGFGKSFLSDSVGRGGSNHPEDVLKTSLLLHANGFLPAPKWSPTEEFHRGVENMQTKLNDLSKGGLLVDGRMNSFRPTEILAQRAMTAGQLEIPEGGKSDGMNAAERFFDAIGRWIERLRGRRNPFEGLHPDDSPRA